MSGSSVGSSSEVNSPISLAATENMRKKLEEFEETRGEPDVEATVDKPHDSPRDFATGNSSVSRSIHQICVIIIEAGEEKITQAMKKSTCKSTNQGAMARRRRRKFMFPPESGESSCQPLITARKYPQIQEEKF
jgi:hypothetical protein